MLRYLLIIAIVVPIVLLVTACAGGGEVGDGTGNGNGGNTTLNQQQFIESQTKCIPFEAESVTTEGVLPVDVLWVVDNSGSMCLDQQNVAAGMANLAAALAGQDLDVHMGYITTDMYNAAQSGQLQNTPTYITSLDQASIDLLANNIANAGCTFSGDEYGGSAVIKAFDYNAPGEPNAGFFRDNASLVVNILSDEDDDSWYVGGVTPAQIVDGIVARKNNDANLVTYNLITHINPDTNPNGPSTDPCYNNGSDELAVKYIETQANLGTRKTNGNSAGIQADICSTNYAATIPTMITEGLITTSSTVTSVDLSGLGFVPYPASISFTLEDGSHPTTGWHYDAATQDVIIDDPALQQSTGTVCAYPQLGEI